MPRFAFKPDSSFFRKISIGAVGTRSVCMSLGAHGHQMVELERGSTDTKLWKEVKRKRVRIPDLVCLRCGVRVECRTKTEAVLSMSHSVADAERSWYFGMVDADWIAFPVCVAAQQKEWSRGLLESDWSFWVERNWVHWKLAGHINFFPFTTFRNTPHISTATKGVTEGSETTLTWDAKFSSQVGVVESIARQKITIRRSADGRALTRTIPPGLPVRVAAGDRVEENQLLASAVVPLVRDELRCPGRMGDDHIPRLVNSRERTQRFTGVKLARLLRDGSQRGAIERLLADPEEDVYVRLEAASYQVAVAGSSVQELFRPYVDNLEDQTRLEAVITLADTNTDTSLQFLSEILERDRYPLFLRSAAAWGLGKSGRELAARRLVRAFGDVNLDIREDAVEAIEMIGGSTTPILLAGLREVDPSIAAGCAEAVRRRRKNLDETSIQALSEQLRDQPSFWAVWLAG